MIALLQRVAEARVEVGGRCVGAIGPGLLVLVCAEVGDGEAEADALVDKLLKLRVFGDAAGKMNLSLRDLAAEGRPAGLLLVSQFTLAADTRGGNRPSFSAAAPAALGRRLYERALDRARTVHPEVAAGEFGADMQVHLINDGPVTLPLWVRPAGVGVKLAASDGS
ncbi:MAG TPA: D-aminoacyl-tRNA deacylase [Methylibium sp.]|nr:D-aminoacyl-tRNA deacylase [Methylibium sp.]